MIRFRASFVILSSLLALSCQSRRFRDSQRSAVDAVTKDVAPSPVATCFSAEEFKPTSSFGEQTENKKFLSETYVQNYLQSNLLFPQTDIALKVFALSFVMKDPEFLFEYNLDQLRLKEKHLDMVAKAVTNAHRMHRVSHSSIRYLVKGTDPIDDNRLQGLVRTSLWNAGFDLHEIARKLAKAAAPEGEEPERVISVKEWTRTPGSQENFCKILKIIDTMKETFKSASVREIDKKWKTDVVEASRLGEAEKEKRVSEIRLAMEKELRPHFEADVAKAGLDVTLFDMIWKTVNTVPAR